MNKFGIKIVILLGALLSFSNKVAAFTCPLWSGSHGGQDVGWTTSVLQNLPAPTNIDGGQHTLIRATDLIFKWCYIYDDLVFDTGYRTYPVQWQSAKNPWTGATGLFPVIAGNGWRMMYWLKIQLTTNMHYYLNPSTRTYYLSKGNAIKIGRDYRDIIGNGRTRFIVDIKYQWLEVPTAGVIDFPNITYGAFEYHKGTNNESTPTTVTATKNNDIGMGTGGGGTTEIPVSNITTCTVSNKEVKLPTISPKVFGSVGSTAAETDFDVEFYCDNEQAVTADVVMVDANNASNTSSILTNMGTAKGVGLQISDVAENGFSKFGTPWEISVRASNAQVKDSFPMKVSYYKTATSVTAGSVQGKTIVTITYE